MADENYRRFTCGGCLQIQAHQPPRGKLPLLCPACKPSAMSREEYRQHVRQNPDTNFCCMECGKAAYRSLSSTNKKKGSTNKFCSQACRDVSRAKVACDRDFYARLAYQHQRTQRLRHRGIRDVARAIAGLAGRRAKQKPCAVCGSQVQYSGMGVPRKYCSDACRRKSDVAKESKKTHKAARKAIKRGAGEAGRFHPHKVFERDGWACRLCGVSTPKSLRGTHHDNAPELDHIIPVSKGGAHTLENTQCLCRACNQWKSDKLVKSGGRLIASRMHSRQNVLHF